jgi:hypothetical protein
VEWIQRYRKANPAKVLLSLARQRAKNNGIPFSITDKDIRIGKFCPVLRVPYETGKNHVPHPHAPSLDRINPSLGYVPGNVVVISRMANTIKHDASFEQIGRVYRWLKRLTSKKKQTR